MRGLLVIMVLVASLLQAASVQAAIGSPKAVEVKQTAGEHAEHDEGLFGKALDLTVWTIVVFLVLLFVLSKFAWTPMLEGLKQREANIHGALEEAQKARAEAEKVRTDLKAEMDSAHLKVKELLDEARRDSQRTMEEMVGKARDEIKTERDRLHRELTTARDQALQEIWGQSAQLATLISAKAIGRQLSQDDHRRLVDEAVSELGTERHRYTAGV